MKSRPAAKAAINFATVTARLKPRAFKTKAISLYSNAAVAASNNRKLLLSSDISFLLRCRCSTYNFYNFFGDLGLARAIHYQRQRFDHVAGIVGGRIHCRHAGGVLGGYGFQQRVENLNAYVLWQNALKKLLGTLLVNIIYGLGSEFRRNFVCFPSLQLTQTDARRPCRLNALLAFLFGGLFRHLNIHLADGLDGEQALGDQTLRYDRLKFIEENVDGIYFFVDIASHNAFAQSGGETEFYFAQNANVFADDLNAAGALSDCFGFVL